MESKNVCINMKKMLIDNNQLISEILNFLYFLNGI